MLAEFRRLFYPHPSNNYKAGLLHPSGLCLLIGFFLFSQSFLSLALNLTPGVLGYASNITPEEIIELTNQKRAEQGIAPLKVNPQLSEAARQKAADMFALNYWSHISPRGTSPWSFIINAGYPYLYAGENLARDFYNASSVVEAWMNSSTHRGNLLNSKYQDIGVAVVDGVLQGQETTLVVQMFAKAQKKPGLISEKAGLQEGTALAEKLSPQKEVASPKIATPVAVTAGSEAEGEKVSLLSGFDLTRTLSLAFAGLLFAVLAIDGLVIKRKKAARISGHNFIHGTFVIILVIMILISQQGLIL